MSERDMSRRLVYVFASTAVVSLTLGSSLEVFHNEFLANHPYWSDLLSVITVISLVLAVVTTLLNWQRWTEARRRHAGDRARFFTGIRRFAREALGNCEKFGDEKRAADPCSNWKSTPVPIDELVIDPERELYRVRSEAEKTRNLLYHLRRRVAGGHVDTVGAASFEEIVFHGVAHRAAQFHIDDLRVRVVQLCVPSSEAFGWFMDGSSETLRRIGEGTDVAASVTPVERDELRNIAQELYQLDRRGAEMTKPGVIEVFGLRPDWIDFYTTSDSLMREISAADGSAELMNVFVGRLLVESFRLVELLNYHAKRVLVLRDLLAYASARR